jgi:hypothetical protein
MVVNDEGLVGICGVNAPIVRVPLVRTRGNQLWRRDLKRVLDVRDSGKVVWEE